LIDINIEDFTERKRVRKKRRKRRRKEVFFRFMMMQVREYESIE